MSCCDRTAACSGHLVVDALQEVDVAVRQPAHQVACGTPQYMLSSAVRKPGPFLVLE